MLIATFYTSHKPKTSYLAGLGPFLERHLLLGGGLDLGLDLGRRGGYGLLLEFGGGSETGLSQAVVDRVVLPLSLLHLVLM